MAALRDIFPDKPSMELESALKNAETVDEAASSPAAVEDKAQVPGNLKEALEMAAHQLYGDSHSTVDKDKFRVNVRRGRDCGIGTPFKSSSLKPNQN